MDNNYSTPEADLTIEDNTNTSGKGKGHGIPEGIKGWSWGAFLFNWLWAIGNKTWIGLLTLVPFVGFIMMFILGVKGREWAWRNKKWDNIEHFQRVQRKWSLWGIIVVGVYLLAVIAAIALPAYQDYVNGVGV